MSNNEELGGVLQGATSVALLGWHWVLSAMLVLTGAISHMFCSLRKKLPIDWCNIKKACMHLNASFSLAPYSLSQRLLSGKSALNVGSRRSMFVVQVELATCKENSGQKMKKTTLSPGTHAFKWLLCAFHLKQVLTTLRVVFCLFGEYSESVKCWP